MAVAKNAGVEKVMMVTEPAGKDADLGLDLLDQTAGPVPVTAPAGAMP